MHFCCVSYLRKNDINSFIECTKSTQKLENFPFKFDIKTRWKLFVKEVEAFIEDVKKLIDFIKPYVVKTIDKTKEIYGKLKAKLKKQS